MPGPLAHNRLTKSPFMGAKPKRSKALRRMRDRLSLRSAGYERMKSTTGYRRPGSQNPRKGA